MAPADAWARTHDRRKRMITIDGYILLAPEGLEDRCSRS